MTVIVLQFITGIAVTSTLTVLVLMRGQRSLRRMARSLPLLVLPFGLSLALWSHNVSPLKTLGNLGEFTAYGAVSGVVPLGQFLDTRIGSRRIPGEVLLALLACLVTLWIYKLVPTLPETSVG